jgi:hypothetical protein
MTFCSLVVVIAGGWGSSSGHPDSPIEAEPVTWTTDGDGDGFAEPDGDCDDVDPSVYAGAPEVDGDNVDSNCDGVDGSLVDIGPHASSVHIGTRAFGAFGTTVDGGPDVDGDGVGDFVAVESDMYLQMDTISVADGGPGIYSSYGRVFVRSGAPGGISAVEFDTHLVCDAGTWEEIIHALLLPDQTGDGRAEVFVTAVPSREWEGDWGLVGGL